MEGGDPMLAVRKNEKSEKKAKKKKEKKKKKKRAKKKKENKQDENSQKESNKDCHIPDDAKPKSNSSVTNGFQKEKKENNCQRTEGLKPPEEVDLGSNTIKRADQASGRSGASCWADAFAIASSVKPLTLGEDFDSEDEKIGPFGGGGDIHLLSRIAMEYAEKSSSSLTTNAKKDCEEIPLSDKKRDICTASDSKDDTSHHIEQEVNPSSKKKRKIEKKHKPCADQSPSMSVVKETDVKNSVTNDHFPFPTDPDDHCESPAVAYEDILPILDTLAQMKNGKKYLRIYDPYYCDGSVVSNLSKLGFDNVYNKKEDCYKTWSESNMTQTYPKYDVIVTNPPYSNDHIQRLIEHVTSKSPKIGKLGTEPWCLLLPTFVHKKDYYKDTIKKTSCQPFYIVPRKRYVYIPPKNFREKKVSDVHKKSSPFVSMWYIWGGTRENNERLITAFRAQEGTSRCEFARSKSALRDLRRSKK